MATRHASKLSIVQKFIYCRSLLDLRRLLCFSLISDAVGYFQWKHVKRNGSKYVIAGEDYDAPLVEKHYDSKGR